MKSYPLVKGSLLAILCFLSQWAFFLVCVCFGLSGCGYGYTAAAYLPHALRAGASVADSLEHCDIDVAVSPNCTGADFAKIKKVAVVFTESQGQIGIFRDITSTVADSCAIELMKLGFDVIEKQQLGTVTKAHQLQQIGMTQENIREAGKVLGVDAVVTGTVVASQDIRMGWLGVGTKRQTVVQSASLKIIEAKQARTMMVITVNYKEGQEPRDAARTMAGVLKKKIEDPFGTI